MRRANFLVAHFLIRSQYTLIFKTYICIISFHFFESSLFSKSVHSITNLKGWKKLGQRSINHEVWRKKDGGGYRKHFCCCKTKMGNYVLPSTSLLSGTIKEIADQFQLLILLTCLFMVSSVLISSSHPYLNPCLLSQSENILFSQIALQTVLCTGHIFVLTNTIQLVLLLFLAVTGDKYGL